MTSQEIEQKIKEIIINQLNGTKIDQINLSTNIVNDLGADSLDNVEIVMALEDVFKITIDDELLNDNINTFQDLVNLVQKCLS